VGCIWRETREPEGAGAEALRVVNQMRQFLLRINAKITELERRKKMNEDAAKQFLKQDNRRGALSKAAIIKRLERMVQRWSQFGIVLDQTILVHEEAVATKAFYDVLGESKKAVDDLLKNINEESVVNLMNKLNEQTHEVSSMSDALADTTGVLDMMDDGEIEEELERLASQLDAETDSGDNNNNNEQQISKVKKKLSVDQTQSENSASSNKTADRPKKGKGELV